MAHVIVLGVKPSDLPTIRERIRTWAQVALAAAARVVQGQVRDFTPRNLGGLVRSITTQAGRGGDEQVITSTSPMLARVHELNAVWSRPPPITPLAMWAVIKLGVSPAEARRVAFAVSRKIFRRGLTLPNAEGRGRMFARTLALMGASGFHMQAFVTSLRTNLGNVFFPGRR